MAVGNFKRQGARRLRPSRISPARNLAFAARSDRFTIPEGVTVTCDSLDSWQQLEHSLDGAATATTTAVLAALWPDSHHILDWRVLAAVAGLGVVSGGDSDLGLVTPNGRDQLLPTLERYAKVRALLVKLADEARLPVTTVERALYLLSRAVQGQGMTWAEYGEALIEATPHRQVPDTDGTPDDEQDVPPAAP
jgi:hypothetical protein